MKYLELIESAYAPLYHGIDKLDYAELALKNNEIAATSTQRFWADGRRRKETDPDYRSSFWMKGVSMTRDINYAMNWGNVVFILDQNILRQKYKIIPFNWGFSGKYQSHAKREREEFVVKKSTWDDYMHLPTEDEPETTLDLNRFMGPEGSIKPLNVFLKGILVDEEFSENGKYPEMFNPIFSSHPKFIGYYDRYKLPKASI